MTRGIFLLLLTLLSVFCFSQDNQRKIDSLETIYKTESLADTTRLKAFSDLIPIFYYSNYERSKELTDSLLKMSLEQNNQRQEAYAYRMKGTFALLDGDYPLSESLYNQSKAIYVHLNDKKRVNKLNGNLAALYGRKNELEKSDSIYQLSLAVSREMKDTNDIVATLTNLGVNSNKLGDYQKALKHYTEALALAEETNDITFKTHNLLLIATTFHNIKDYNQAYEYYLKAEDIAKQTENYPALEGVYNGLAVLHDERDSDFETALKYQKKNLELSKQTGDIRSLELAYLNNGLLLQKLGLFNDAETHLLEGYSLAKKGGIENQLHGAELKLASLYTEMGQDQKAMKYFNLAQNKSGINEYGSDDMKIYSEISTVQAKRGLYKDAYNSLLKYANLSDSIYQGTMSNRLNEVETKYQVSQKENENFQLKQEKQEQELKTLKASRQRSAFGIGLLAVSLLGGLSFVSYRKVKKQKQHIEHLQRELHHRMKNNLGLVDAFIETAQDKMKNDYSVQLLNELRSRVKNIAQVHELLTKSDDMTKTNLKEYLNKVVQNVEQGITNGNINIKMNVPNDVDLESSKSTPMALIVNEFLTNSFKYAFPKNQKGEVEIEVQEEPNAFHLQLKDNGVGLPADFDVKQAESFGLTIMMLLAEQLNGSFDLESKGGVEVNVSFPK